MTKLEQAREIVRLERELVGARRARERETSAAWQRATNRIAALERTLERARKK